VFLDRLLGRHRDRSHLEAFHPQIVLHEFADSRRLPSNAGQFLDPPRGVVGRVRRVLAEVLFDRRSMRRQGTGLSLPTE